MQFFSVYARGRGEKAGENVILVKEGFSWGAFFFLSVWFLYQKMWMCALITIGILCGSFLICDIMSFDQKIQAGVFFFWSIVFGLFANDLRCWSLVRACFSFVDVVSGENYEHALVSCLNRNKSI